MKKPLYFFFILSVFIVSSTNLLAQINVFWQYKYIKGGVFLADTDFVFQHLRYPIVHKQKQTKLSFSRHLSSELLVKVKQADTLLELHSQDCWGYVHNGYIIRFDKGKHFMVLDTQKIVLYKNYFDNHRHKTYYFSRGLNDKVFPLTLPNLALVYKDNKKFLRLLKNSKTLKKLLTAYDTKHRSYMVADLLTTSEEESDWEENKEAE
jgi:hypothetical protein